MFAALQELASAAARAIGQLTGGGGPPGAPPGAPPAASPARATAARQSPSDAGGGPPSSSGRKRRGPGGLPAPMSPALRDELLVASAGNPEGLTDEAMLLENLIIDLAREVDLAPHRAPVLALQASAARQRCVLCDVM